MQPGDASARVVKVVSNIRYTHENAFVGCFGVAVRTDCDSEIGAFEGNPSPNMTTVSYCAERPGGRVGAVESPPVEIDLAPAATDTWGIMQGSGY